MCCYDSAIVLEGNKWGRGGKKGKGWGGVFMESLKDVNFYMRAWLTRSVLNENCQEVVRSLLLGLAIKTGRMHWQRIIWYNSPALTDETPHPSRHLCAYTAECFPRQDSLSGFWPFDSFETASSAIRLRASAYTLETEILSEDLTSPTSLAWSPSSLTVRLVLGGRTSSGRPKPSSVSIVPFDFLDRASLEKPSLVLFPYVPSEGVELDAFFPKRAR